MNYLDTTFCRDADDCANLDCKRRVTDEDRVLSEAMGLPIGYSSMAWNCKDLELKKEAA